MTSMAYKRTQPGTGMMVVVVLALALETLVSVGRPVSPITIAVAVVLLSIGIVFSTMTIAVTDDSVEWWFTLGALRQRLPLREIESATSEKVKLVDGLGVRTNGRDRLWIVSGSYVISFALRDGRKISLGSPEARDLALLVDRILAERR